MNYATVKNIDVANGPGVRVSLFVSGCTHHCKGCFNPETWDFSYGSPFSEEVEEEILEALSPAYIRGFTCLGGEPMEPENRGCVLDLLRKIREKYPAKKLWLYTGYLFDRDLCVWAETDDTVREMLELLDVIVDGEFVLEKKNLKLRFRGSENQRLIDVQASRKEGTVVEIKDPERF